MSNTYNKPILTIDEQITLYTERGLEMETLEEFKYALKEIWYFRLWIYGKHFEFEWRYRNWTTDTKILELYNFDKELRFLLLEYLDIIEQSFKTALIRQLWEEFWTFWHSNISLFDCDWQKNCWDLVQELLSGIIDWFKNKNPSDQRTYTKDILTHYYSNYSWPEYPPIRMMMHLMSFGECVRLYRYLTPTNKIILANHYKLNWKLILWWMYCMSNFRNTCAHWERIRNKVFVSQIQKPGLIWLDDRNPKFTDSRNKLFDYVLVMYLLMNQIWYSHNMWDRIQDLLNKYDINFQPMWFPNNRKDIIS